MTIMALSWVVGLSSSEISDAKAGIFFPFATFFTWLTQSEVKKIGVVRPALAKKYTHRITLWCQTPKS